MATNHYIESFKRKSEQGLLNDIFRECIQFNGYDVMYLPRDLVNEDYLYGEDTISQFNSAFEIEMYIQSIDGFGGEGDFISRFGFEIRDELEVIVHRDRFTDATGIENPKEGDLIYFPLSKGIFEIKFVEDEQPFFQLGKNYTFVLTCEIFEYSQEVLDTGIVDVDAVEDDLENNDSVVNDPFADNTKIEIEGDTIQDFTQDSPFSEDF